MTKHDQSLLLKAAEILAKDDDLAGVAAIVRRVAERQRITDGEPAEGTVRVRVAVAVDKIGRWEAAGYHGWRETTTPDLLTESKQSASRALHWITADVPVPLPQTIPAEVTDV